ncbi:hypothetical protein GOV03_02145 [Candidatus Woesearchaeota archaeon]|nr:hypothetical protein [Candidatus Woesearchaeota archaeon]
MFGDRKRTFKELQFIILKTLKKGDSTTHKIAKKTSLHFHTVQHQLILLKGQDYVVLAFEHNRFRLFSITDKGKKYLKELTKKLK